MPTFALEIKAILENVMSLTPIGGVLWKLDIESEGGAEKRENVTIDTGAEEQELDGSRGTAHFLMKWSKGDSHQAYIKILDPKKALGDKKKKKKTEGGSEIDGTYSSQTEEWVPILCLECRGLRPTAFHIGNDFDIRSVGGTVFRGGELTQDRSGLEWTDYDEENDCSVSISQLQSRIVEV
jgi:hypothetical protein